MPYYFASSHSHYWGKRSNGSTSTKIETLHGITAPLPSQQSSFPQARPMLCVGESQVLSSNMMNLSLRHGNTFKTIYQNVIIMGWRIDYTCRHSTTGLANSTHETMDVAAGGVFLSLTLPSTTTLVEKMASNQGWNEERVQTHKRGGGMHQLKEVDMLSTKIDPLTKKLKDRANGKQ